MKRMTSIAEPAVFYSAPNMTIDPLDRLPLDHDLATGRLSGEACMVSFDPWGSALFVSVGERIEDWVERRKGGRID